MRCVTVVPFLNEEAHLGTFLESVDAQSRRPDRLILVDDGSDDASPAIAEAFAATRAWVTVRRRVARPEQRDRLADAPELAAFLWAAEQLGDDFDVLVKMDADLSLAPQLFERVLEAFASDPGLGMAGTFLFVAGPDGRLRRERHPATHVRGSTRFYRRRCFEDVSPIPQILGWDGADEVRARARGWRTRSLILDGPPSVHLRPTGSHDGRLRARSRWGRCAYAVGSHPLAILAAASLQARQRPWILGALAFVWGSLRAWWRGAPRAPLDVRRAKRAEQRARMRQVRVAR